MLKRLAPLLFLLSLLIPTHAWAVATCTITGTVDDGSGNPIANGVITFNTLYVQVISGNPINQTLVSTTTDASGVLSPISLAQGVYVQVTINGGAPVTAIVPFAASTTFASLISNVVTNPTLTTLTVTGQTPAPACTTGSATLYFDSVTNLLMLNNNCSPFGEVLTAANNFPDCQDAGGNHLNYIASSRMLTCGTSSSGGGGGGSNPQTDATAILFNQADNTKLLKFDLSGLSTATTRTLVVPNRNATLGTTTGTLTSGNLAKFDASGNLVDDGIAIASLSGNTTKVGTVSGALTPGNVVKSDGSGNLVDGGSAVGKQAFTAACHFGGASTSFFPLSGIPAANGDDGCFGTEPRVKQPLALAGTLKTLYCVSSVAPGNTKSWAFTVRKNASDQGVTCTISGASSTLCSDVINTSTVTAGDVFDTKIVATGSPTNGAVLGCSMEFDPS